MPHHDELRKRQVIVGVLDDGERLRIEAAFGVSSDQVVRDHVISHTLAAIASVGADDVLFFGGTALSRTHLTDLRLSEDIDLIALGDRNEVCGRIEAAIVHQLRRKLGAVTFTPRLGDTRHSEPSVMQVGDARVRIQLLSSVGYPNWPTQVAEIELRYSDVPPARLRVPTPAAFVSAKLSAWSDRHAPRDLYDLWALGEKGMIDRDAVELFGRTGPHTSALKISFTRAPSDEEWAAALGHQGIIRIGPRAAADAVRQRIAAEFDL